MNNYNVYLLGKIFFSWKTCSLNSSQWYNTCIFNTIMHFLIARISLNYLNHMIHLRFFSTNTLLTGWLTPVGAANTGCWSGLFLCSSSMMSSSSTSSSLEQCISAGRGFLLSQDIQRSRKRTRSKILMLKTAMNF